MQYLNSSELMVRQLRQVMEANRHPPRGCIYELGPAVGTFLGVTPMH